MIRRWQPWTRSTGPRTEAGKAKASRNAWKGGYWREIRELRRMLNAEILEAREYARHVTT